MKVFTIVHTLLATASANSLFSDREVAIEDSLDVPGNSPLRHCDDFEDDILDLKSVDLKPDSFRAGDNLTVTARGHLSEDIESGAYVELQVTFGVIKLITTQYDLCELAEKVDLKCPIKKGDLALTKKVTLPKEYPPGKYNVLADVYTNEDVHITCLTATVMLGGKGKVQVHGKEDDNNKQDM